MTLLTRFLFIPAVLLSGQALSDDTNTHSDIHSDTHASTELAPLVIDAKVDKQGLQTTLETSSEAASYTGLSAAETPATVNVITQEQMQSQGLRSLIEVYNAAPGVRAGNLPGEPGTTTMRGFSRAATGYLVDGVRAVDPLLTSRNHDSYNFERVEILKGPASVINGTGALAGAINLVTRKPRLEQASQDVMLAYGTFDTLRAGASVNRPLNDKTAVQASLSYGQSSGYVDDTESNNLGLTTGVLHKVSERLTLSASLDYFSDNFETAYFGTPLIAESLARDPSGIVSTANGLVIDESLRDKNYNVNDGSMESDTVWLRTNADYLMSESWKLRNELSFYSADRAWINAEDYLYNSGTQLLDRYTTLITHDHQFWAERLSLTKDSALNGRRNRLAVGGEYIDTDFGSKRRFGTTSAVDPFDPDRGDFPEDNAVNFSSRNDFESQVKTTALFMEDALNFTPQWLGVISLRRESIQLDREIHDVTADTITRFDRNYTSNTWRVGSVYELANGTALFAQYNQGAVPVTTLLLSNAARAEFELSTGRSLEAGIKTPLGDGRATLLVSVYQIEQDDILTRDPLTPSLTIQGGSQRSRGIEVEFDIALTAQWQLSANANLQQAEFTEMTSSSGDDQSGNRPSNVPNRTLNLNTTYTLMTMPLTIGVGISNVGDFYTDTANTIKVDGHTLLNASLSYPLGDGTLELRGRNLTDEFYADWSGYSSTQVYIGAPRSHELSYRTAF